MIKIGEKLKEMNVDVVAVCYLNSYINPTNEIRTREILSKIINVPIIISSEVDPLWKEYERFSTTIINAILTPIVTKYLDNLCRLIENYNISRSRIYVMSSWGGFVDTEYACRNP